MIVLLSLISSQSFKINSVSFNIKSDSVNPFILTKELV